MKTYSVAEIAKLLNVNKETVRRWIRSGQLKSTQKSKKTVMLLTNWIYLNLFKQNRNIEIWWACQSYRLVIHILKNLITY